MNTESIPLFLRQGSYLFVLFIILPVVMIIGFFLIITKTIILELKDMIISYLESSNE